MSRTHPGRFHIAIPGPTNIPERILNAMHISSEDQRNPEIPNLTIPVSYTHLTLPTKRIV